MNFLQDIDAFYEIHLRIAIYVPQWMYLNTEHKQMLKFFCSYHKTPTLMVTFSPTFKRIICPTCGKRPNKVKLTSKKKELWYNKMEKAVKKNKTREQFWRYMHTFRVNMEMLTNSTI